MKKVLVTGGAGFIGSALVKQLATDPTRQILVLDALTYAAQPASIKACIEQGTVELVVGDICDGPLLATLFARFQPDTVFHLAAESHVDRSIAGPAAFIQTNIVGTFELLEAARGYWQQLPDNTDFCFFHVSTDEVYGDLASNEPPATELHGYAPSSPYSAAKASSDHLVHAWHRTYGLPVIMSHCSNNYGPWQYPEKLIPLLITKALKGEPLPIYGDGLQQRDWLFVDDHAKALLWLRQHGLHGQRYNIGADNPLTNLQLVQQLCAQLDQRISDKPKGLGSFAELICHVPDRPGHDRRYALNCQKLKALGWNAETTWSDGLTATIDFYVGLQQES